MNPWVPLLLLLAVALIQRLRMSDFSISADSPLWIKLLFTAGAVITLALAVGPVWLSKPKRSPDWWALKTAIDDITEAYQPIIWARPEYKKYTLTHEQRIAWLNKIREQLESQNNNAVLLSNDEALARWRAAQNTIRMAKTIEDACATGSDNPVFFSLSESAIKNVMDVFVSEIFGSTEPGGGRGPKP